MIPPDRIEAIRAEFVRKANDDHDLGAILAFEYCAEALEELLREEKEK